VIAPGAVLFYCLFVRAGVFDGWAGFYYAFQRMLAELMLSLYLIEKRFAKYQQRQVVDASDSVYRGGPSHSDALRGERPEV
jgi:hypothetical protein